MNSTESVEDTLLSPTKPTKDNRFPKYSNSKFFMQGHNDYYIENTRISCIKKKKEICIDFVNFSRQQNKESSKRIVSVGIKSFTSKFRPIAFCVFSSTVGR